MSTLVEPETTTQETSPSQRLRATMAAVRVSFSWLGVRKSLSPQQKAQAAESFGAEAPYLSAGKKLLDTKHPALKAVSSVRGRALAYWKGISLPYTEAGIRLIRRDDMAAFDVQLTTFRAELDEAVQELDRCYDELKLAACQRLGRLYDDADYPPTLSGLFGIEWDYPSLEPPSYLQQLSPELYEQEQARVQARFNEAVQLAEDAFLSELCKLVSHLSERITGDEDGKPKVFRDSAITNLHEFLDRFRELNIRSNDQLEQLVDQCHRLVDGIRPQHLRDSRRLRQHVATELSSITSVIDGLLVDRPRRNILRRPR